jgi:hypothetical protein
MPMMAFIGVRISWLMLARKALLAWLAASAASLAAASSAVRSATMSCSWFWNLSRARSSSLWRVMSLHMVDE